MAKIMQFGEVITGFSESDATFINNVNKFINEIQNNGLEVEIQYSVSSDVRGVWIIGREKDKKQTLGDK